MLYLYILLSQKDNNLYVGVAENVEERLRRHNSGYVQATKARRPFVVIYTEEHQDESEAFKRERFLKSLWGAREKKKIKEMYLQRLKP